MSGEQGRLHAAQQIPHQPTVQLKHAERVSAAEYLVRLRVIDTQPVEVEVLAAVGLAVVDRVAGR
jgi:hypothetical protein